MVRPKEGFLVLLITCCSPAVTSWHPQKSGQGGDLVCILPYTGLVGLARKALHEI